MFDMNCEVKNDDLLNVSQAADFLQVKVATVYSWVHKQKVPYRKHGSRLVFSRDSLLKWSAAQEVAPKELVDRRRRYFKVR